MYTRGDSKETAEMTSAFLGEGFYHECKRENVRERERDIRKSGEQRERKAEWTWVGTEKQESGR